MKLSTYHYTQALGWDQPLDSRLDSENTWLIVFGGADANPLMSAMDDLKHAFPQAQWTGCSTSGEIHRDSLHDHSLVVAVLKFESTQLRLANANIQNPDQSREIGAQLGDSLNAPNLRAVFVLSDGLGVNGSSLIRGLTSSLPCQVVITGGLAGDGDRFQKTWVLNDKSPQAQHVSAIGLYGDSIRVGHGSKGGWDVLGAMRQVTHAVGNVVYSIDHQPALTLYKKYLGDRASGLPATGLLFPLAILNTDSQEDITVRALKSVNEADESISFAGDIPTGSTVRLMRANFERLIDGAGEAAAQIGIDDYQGGPMLSIAISCIGRRLVLGQRTEEELEAVCHDLPLDSSLIGYYSYGEISPLANGRCDLHSQTMTISTFWER